MRFSIQKFRDDTGLLATLGGWAAILLATVIVYAPGLNGPFVLDDYGAIAAMGNYGGVVDWETFKSYVFGGYAGPTGRPVALLSFLIDGNNWPTDSFPFKRTNLIIHLLTGIALGVLTRQILTALEFDKASARIVVLVSTACWLLHPFLVSTTLYAVQRMAQLSTLFVFLGLIGYMYGRSFLQENATRAYLVMSGSIAFFTLMAMLSKENGILLPLLVGVVEVTVFSRPGKQPTAVSRAWIALFVLAPTVLVVGYLLKTAVSADFFTVVPPRSFSLYERLLSESRILFDYLQNWFLPKLYTTGVFQDHYVKSTGLFSPITTVVSIALHSIIIVVALIKRREWPLLSLGVLFFYCSHLLESTVLNLELYFEHRNYLAVAFILPGVVSAAYTRMKRPVFWLAISCVLLALSGFTRYSTTIWSSYPAMVEVAARKAPLSVRAQARYAASLFNAGQYDVSLEVLDNAIRDIPGEDPLLLVNRLTILCELGVLTHEESRVLTEALSRTHYDPRMIKVYSTLLIAVTDGSCPGVKIEAFVDMFAKMLDVPSNGNPDSLEFSQIKYFLGVSLMTAGRPADALTAFEASLTARPDASSAMKMAATMATAGYYDEALKLSGYALDQIETHGASGLTRPTVNRSDIEYFRSVVREDRENAMNVRDADTVDPTR